MTRSDKVVRLAVRINDCPNRGGFFLSGNAGLVRDVIDRHGKSRLERSGIVRDHRHKFEPLARFRQNRHADLSASMLEHEVDLGIGNGFGSANEVSFVFPVFVVHHDDDFPGFDGG